MASYNLNEVLKKKNAEKKQQSNNQEIHLDDVSRVKVLSPGRQVLKRFARNRLAVFGTILPRPDFLSVWTEANFL